MCPRTLISRTRDVPTCGKINVGIFHGDYTPMKWDVLKRGILKAGERDLPITLVKCYLPEIPYKDHPDTLTSMNNLAEVLHRQGKHEQAEELLRRVS